MHTSNGCNQAMKSELQKCHSGSGKGRGKCALLTKVNEWWRQNIQKCHSGSGKGRGKCALLTEVNEWWRQNIQKCHSGSGKGVGQMCPSDRREWVMKTEHPEMSLWIWQGGGANVPFWQTWMSDEDRTSRNVTLDLERGRGKCAFLAVVTEPRRQHIKYSQITSLAEIFSILMTSSSEHPPFKPWIEHLQWSPTQVTAPFPWLCKHMFTRQVDAAVRHLTSRHVRGGTRLRGNQPCPHFLHQDLASQTNRQCRIFCMKKWYRQAASFEVSLSPSFQNIMCPRLPKNLKIYWSRSATFTVWKLDPIWPHSVLHACTRLFAA